MSAGLRDVGPQCTGAGRPVSGFERPRGDRRPTARSPTPASSKAALEDHERNGRVVPWRRGRVDASGARLGAGVSESRRVPASRSTRRRGTRRRAVPRTRARRVGLTHAASMLLDGLTTVGAAVGAALSAAWLRRSSSRRCHVGPRPRLPVPGDMKRHRGRSRPATPSVMRRGPKRSRARPTRDGRPEEPPPAARTETLRLGSRESEVPWCPRPSPAGDESTAAMNGVRGEARQSGQSRASAFARARSRPARSPAANAAMRSRSWVSCGADLGPRVDMSSRGLDGLRRSPVPDHGPAWRPAPG